MEGFTGYYDVDGVPIFVNDLLECFQVELSTEREVYHYKKVMVINGRLHLVSIRQLGLKPTTECRKVLMKDFIDACKPFVIDGDLVAHPGDGRLLHWWQRKEAQNLLTARV